MPAAKIAKVVGEYLSTEPARDRLMALGYRVTGFDTQKSSEIIASDRAAFTELLKTAAMKMH